MGVEVGLYTITYIVSKSVAVYYKRPAFAFYIGGLQNYKLNTIN